ncbi:chemotaxis protein CheW [Oxalobacter vibrioformis]|uniref:Chemotaxis protein CheW n=1 Tax=Oxalobacter vibrioformis TaxID=933080 RepID=A0A9E9LUN0_9BURK|nr:chemotaxis protein CheW [Oxalobacter vibrioformis]NLC24428.1 chemotaxis protein CheW [Oxalobacter sp.]WAW09486.1 chemotaxis protein CheW [Oxalobacter vibrioformis]
MVTNLELTNASSNTVASAPQEYLAFRLGNEEYGIDILKVQEIREYEPTTKLANVPGFILGLSNLRGAIVPIIDMRIKFNLGEANYDHLTVTIILNIGERIVGMVVDSVSDVIALTPEQIRPAPPMGTLMDTDNLIGLGTLEDRMLILVDIEKLMSAPDMGLSDTALPRE